MLKKIFKNLRLITQVAFHLLKYRLLKLFLSNDTFYLKVSSYDKNKYLKNLKYQKQPLNNLIGQIDRIVHYIDPSANCLIESLVKRDVLAKNGYSVLINLSIYKTSTEYRTHAWIINPGMTAFKTLHRI